MNNIREKVKEVQDYFVMRLKKGEYEVIETNAYTKKVKIDGYLFNVWIANGVNGIITYDLENFMQLELSIKDKEEISKHIDFETGVLNSIKEKEEEIRKLKERLNEKSI